MNGEKIIGKRTGRLVTSLVVAKGWKVRPRSVFVQMYAIKIKKIFFLISFDFAQDYSFPKIFKIKSSYAFPKVKWNMSVRIIDMGIINFHGWVPNQKLTSVKIWGKNIPLMIFSCSFALSSRVLRNSPSFIYLNCRQVGNFFWLWREAIRLP